MSKFDSRPEHVNNETPSSGEFSAGILDRQITATFGIGKTQSVWRDRRTMTFGAFIGELGRVEIGPKDGRCYVPAVFTGTERKMDRAERIEIAVLDSDCGYTRAEIASALKAEGLAGFIHSTASHLKDTTEVSAKSYDRWRGAEGADFDEAEAPAEYLRQYKGYLSRVSDGARIDGKSASGKECVFRHQPIPKFRIVMPLARPWLAADYPDAVSRHADWRGRILAVAELLRLHSDQSCTDASRLFYTPRVKDAAAVEAFESEFIDGAALDIHAVAPLVDQQAAPSPQRARAKQQGAPDREPKKAPETNDDPNRYRIGDLDLRSWYTSMGRAFEITKALKARGKAPFGNRISPPKYHLECAFDDYHTTAGDRTGMFVVDASKRAAAGMPAITSGFIAKCKHDACAGRDHLDHVKRMVELGWLTVADLTDKRFLFQAVKELPELPPFELPTMSGEEGAVELERVVKAYFDHFERYRARQRWRDERLQELTSEAEEAGGELSEKELARLKARATREATKRFGKIEDALAVLRLQIAASAGIGKTLIMVREYRSRPALWGEHINFYGQNIKNCQDFVARINAEPIPQGMPRAVVITGYTYKDEDMAEPACKKAEIVAEAVGKIAGGVHRAFCKNDTAQCEFYGSCLYTKKRLDKASKIRAFPHASLAMSPAGEIETPEPALIIVDEKCLGAVKKRTTVEPARLADPATYGNDPENRAETADDHAALGTKVLRLLRTVPDVPGKLLESDADRIKAREDRLGHMRSMEERDIDGIPARLRRAAKGADGGGELATVFPSDSVETVRAKLAEVTGDRQGKAVAALLRQLARDVERYWTTSIGVEYVHADGKKFKEDCVLVHDLKKLEFNEKTPLILIDADAVAEINNEIFARNSVGLRCVEIRCKRRQHTTQASDFLGARSQLVPKLDEKNPGSVEHCRLAKEHLANMADFAAAKAQDGAKAVVFLDKPVRVAMTGEEPGENGKLKVNFHDHRGFDVSHIGMTIGRNDWHRHNVGVQIGREEPSCQEINRLARAIYANTRELVRFEPLNFPTEYQRVLRRRFPGSPDFVEFNGYTDPRLQAILELHRERAVCQNIDRLRPLFKEAEERRIRWFILCKLPLPGIIPDRLDTLANILAGGSAMERAFIGGLVTTNAVVMAGVHRHLFPTPDAARVDIQREHLAQALEEQAKAHSANKEDSICRMCLFAEIKDLAPLHVPGRFRVVDPSSGNPPPRWSPASVAPSRYRRADISILSAAEAPMTAHVEFDGEMTVVVNIARRQDDALDRIHALTKDDASPAEGAAFVAAVTEFFNLLAADARVPAPDSWRSTEAETTLPPLSEKPVPAGRMFKVTYRNASGGIALLWWFPDVAGGAFVDQWRNPIEPQTEVRAAVERLEPPISAAEAAAMNLPANAEDIFGDDIMMPAADAEDCFRRLREMALLRLGSEDKADLFMSTWHPTLAGRPADICGTDFHACAALLKK